jgi:fatty-acyl-CoA synthase
VTAAQAGPTIGSLALRVLRRHPERVAFTGDGCELTYGQADALIGGYQAVLVAAGLDRGARVAVLSANRAEAWCAAIAVQALGMAVVWLHPRASAADQRAQLRDAEVDWLIVDERDHQARGGELDGEAAHTWTFGPSELAEDLESAVAGATPVRAVDVADRADVAQINYTGGTTGRSRAIVRRQPAALALLATAVLADFELPPEPRYLALAPFSHVGGTKLLPVLARGGTIHVASRFDPEAVLARIADERISMTLLVPTMIYALLDHPALERTDLSSLELLLYGAAPIAPDRLQDGLERIGPVFSQFYGQTECYPISLLSRADHRDPALLGSCGTPVSTCAVRLIDERGADTLGGEAGEIVVRSPATMELPDDGEASGSQADGWLATGDIARADERGFLHLVDRKRDMIISGGFNVYSREVEDALSAHPDVAVAAVFGVPHERWGEAVTATVVLRPGARADATALREHVRALKGPVQAPRAISFVDQLPVTALGKIDKPALRATAARQSGTTQRISSPESDRRDGGPGSDASTSADRVSGAICRES